MVVVIVVVVIVVIVVVVVMNNNHLHHCVYVKHSSEKQNFFDRIAMHDIKNIDIKSIQCSLRL